MKDNRNTFPKLETGMVVRVRGESSHRLGPYLVVGNKFMSTTGYCEVDTHENDGTYADDFLFDIVTVYDGKGVYSLNLEKYLEKFTPIWEFKEQCPTQAKIAELEETIKKSSQQIQQLKEEINV